MLGFHLKEVDFAVLSHGHYDHGGGLENFLKLNDHAIVYIHKDAFLPYYNAKDKYIGLDVKLKENERIDTEDRIIKLKRYLETINE